MFYLSYFSHLLTCYLSYLEKLPVSLVLLVLIIQETGEWNRISRKEAWKERTFTDVFRHSKTKQSVYTAWDPKWKRTYLYDCDGNSFWTFMDVPIAVS
jgi:hypothetical protein